MTYADTMSRHAARYLTQTLREQGGNITQAAKAAGISRVMFYRHCKKLGIHMARYVPAPYEIPSFATWRLPAATLTGVRT